MDAEPWLRLTPGIRSGRLHPFCILNKEGFLNAPPFVTCAAPDSLIIIHSSRGPTSTQNSRVCCRKILGNQRSGEQVVQMGAQEDDTTDDSRQ